MPIFKNRMGSVIVNSNNIIIDGQNADWFTGIRNATNTGSTGMVGSIEVNAEILKIFNYGKINIFGDQILAVNRATSI